LKPSETFGNKAVQASRLISLIGTGTDIFTHATSLLKICQDSELIDEIFMQVLLQIIPSPNRDEWSKSINNYWLALQIFTNTFPGGGRRQGVSKVAEKVIRDEIEREGSDGEAAVRYGKSIMLNLHRGSISRNEIEPYFEIRSGRPLAQAYEF
jgi:hypothetical protein